MVSWLPLFHDMGMVGFLTLPMCLGIEVVKVTPVDFLSNPLLWVELISRHRGTCTAAPNFAYAITARVMARADPGLDLSSMRFALNGAEPIDVTAVQAFIQAGAPFGLSPNAMVPAYGMAEATLGVSFHPWGTPVKIDVIDAEQLENERLAVQVDRETSGSTRAFPLLGPPVPGIEVAVRDGDGVVRGDREVGVLFLRGEPVTDLYLTVDGPRPTRDPDGWLDTGDLGYLVDGEVVVCGRVKDVIIMGGRNIYPTDIERVAESVSGVRAGNAAAVRWSVDGRRESFAIAVESRAAGRPGRGRPDRRRHPRRGDQGDRRPSRCGDGAPRRDPAEDAVGQTATAGDGEADHLKLQSRRRIAGTPSGLRTSEQHHRPKELDHEHHCAARRPSQQPPIALAITVVGCADDRRCRRRRAAPPPPAPP